MNEQEKEREIKRLKEIILEPNTYMEVREKALEELLDLVWNDGFRQAGGF